MNNTTNKKISLFIYRSILRQCKFFDKNPQYKKLYRTPESLRDVLPTFYLPSVSFTQQFKQIFTSINEEVIKNEKLITSSHSKGFNVLKNLNIAIFQNDFQNIKDKNNKQGISSTFNSDDIDRTVGSSLANLQLNRFLKQQQQNTKQPETSIQKLSSGSLLSRDKKQKKSEIVSQITDKKKVEVVPQITDKKNNKKQKKITIEAEIVNNETFIPIQYIKPEDIKPGTVLVSHPSNEKFQGSIILITHVINDMHYGFVLNQTIPTLPTISFLQEHISMTSSLMKNDNKKYSKNLMNHLKNSLSRPLAHFSSSSWFYGGPKSILDNKLFTNGIDGLEIAHVIHNNPNIQGSKMVREGLYLGGSLKDINNKLVRKQVHDDDLLFFIGCSVWNPNQLAKEIQEGAWFVANTSNSHILKTFKGHLYWENALKSMGGDYRDLVK